MKPQSNPAPPTEMSNGPQGRRTLVARVRVHAGAHSSLNGHQNGSRPETGNPWIDLAGKYENDPCYADMLEEIRKFRAELDAQQ